MNKTGIITLVGMVIVIAVVALYIIFRDQSVIQKHSQTPAATALLPEGDAASFTDMQGEPVSVADDFGTIMIVMTWASWCPQCGADIARLGELAKEFPADKVKVIAINRAEDKYSAERFLNTITVPEGVQIILDPDDHYFSKSAGYAMPETIIYTKSGEEALHQRGEFRLDEAKNTVAELLK